MEARERKLIALEDRGGGTSCGIRTHLRPGRLEVTTVGHDPYVQLRGSDPWNSQVSTGLVVPTTPTLSAQTRYLFQLARISFNTPESAWLTGLRLYASLFGFDDAGNGPFELEITSPMWRFSIGGGNISYHVMAVPKTWRDTRNPANTDSLVFLDSAGGPALLYQGAAPLYLPPNPLLAIPYVPPNGGRPWGKALISDLGNIHDNRFPWRSDHAETALRIPIPAPCDIIVYASVWQHTVGEQTPNRPSFSCSQFSAAGPEDRFWATFNNVQYGRVAASLIIGQEMGKAYGQGDDDFDDDDDGEAA